MKGDVGPRLQNDPVPIPFLASSHFCTVPQVVAIKNPGLLENPKPEVTQTSENRSMWLGRTKQLVTKNTPTCLAVQYRFVGGAAGTLFPWFSAIFSDHISTNSVPIQTVDKNTNDSASSLLMQTQHKLYHSPLVTAWVSGMSSGLLIQRPGLRATRTSPKGLSPLDVTLSTLHRLGLRNTLKWRRRTLEWNSRSDGTYGARREEAWSWQHITGGCVCSCGSTTQWVSSD